MGEIVTSVKHVADIMGEITAASQEQSTGIEEVNRAITQMDEITQQNAALVEQAAAAAESLQEQADVLAKAVSVFRITPAEAQHKPVISLQAPSRPPSSSAPAKLPAAAKTSALKATGKPAPRTVSKPVEAGGANEWEEF
jgi:uncharacterized phage infection (PIP) family protein YhgE